MLLLSLVRFQEASVILLRLLIVVGSSISFFWVNDVSFATVCQSGLTIATKEPDHSEYFSELIGELKKRWPKNRTIRMVFHGHSVPAGYFQGGRVRRFDSYPILFHQILGDAYPTAVIDICTTAIGGEGSASGAKRFEQDVLSLKPDVIFIDYSLNDRSAGLESSYRSWRTMIEHATASNVKVVLLTPTPDSSEDILDGNSPLAKHASQVRQLGIEFSVPVVDSYDMFRELVAADNDIQKYLSQANHPNRIGHMIVAKLLAELFAQDPIAEK